MDVEIVTYGEKRLAVIVRESTEIKGKEFISSNEDYLQVGFMSLKKGEKIHPHEHRINKRYVEKTHEVLYILSGKVKVDFYINKKKIEERILNGGDLIILVDGGHGFEFLEKTKLFEVKQGPYTGVDLDKEKFSKEGDNE